MINILDKSNCCGCSACVQRCPKHCITLHQDIEGFLYPQVDCDACISCGLCEKVCPQLSPFDEHKPLNTLAAMNNDKDVRKRSSSGGFFSLLASKIIADGGVVFGARFNEEWQVVLDYADTEEGLAAFRGSKYVQAIVGDSYLQCEQFLKNGQKVLFSGTPCQIAGLKRYLSKEYNNLLAVEVACHGVPSPEIWRSYLREVLDKINSPEGFDLIKELKFKISFDFESQELKLYSNRHENDYTSAFIHSTILRPSCYSCKFKLPNSCADLTIADFWGVQVCDRRMDDDLGTTLVIEHTQNAIDIVQHIDAKFNDESYEMAVRYNSALEKSSGGGQKAEIFLVSGDKYTSSFLRNTIPAKKTTLRQKIKRYIKTLVKQVQKNKSIIQLTSNQFASITCGKQLMISDVEFRNKAYGWKQYRFAISFKLIKK